VLDDFSRYIVAWKLCTTMKAEDVTSTLELALQASGLDQVNVAEGGPKQKVQSDHCNFQELGLFCYPVGHE
jgi:transposase InsO family protein